MSTKHSDTCLQKAADDEPIFVLVAHDLLAPTIVLFWVSCARAAGVPEAKLQDAVGQANAMKEWQKNHGTKLPA